MSVKMTTGEGFTAIPNSYMDYLIARSSDLTKRELQIMLVVIRNTLGWRRDQARLSCRFLSNATGISPGNVSTSLKSLETKGMVRIDRSGGPTASIILTVPLTVPKSGTGVFPNQEQGCSRIRNRGVPKIGTEVFPK
jgi:phage replication O-like protein O